MTMPLMAQNWLTARAWMGNLTREYGYLIRNTSPQGVGY